MVEASIVLPILILTILSLIMLLIFFYSSLTMQVNVHEKLMTDYKDGEKFFSIASKSDATSSQMGGIVSLIMNKEFTATYYEINEARVLRLGEAIGDRKQ